MRRGSGLPGMTLRAQGMVGVGLLCAAFAASAARAIQDTGQDAHLPAAPAPITDGAVLFKERGCLQCHAIRGEGGHKGPDLSGVGRRLKADAIQKQIQLGGGEMPAFGEALPPEEIEALVKFLGKCRDKNAKGKTAGRSAATIIPAPSAG